MDSQYTNQTLSSDPELNKNDKIHGFIHHSSFFLEIPLLKVQGNHKAKYYLHQIWNKENSPEFSKIAIIILQTEMFETIEIGFTGWWHGLSGYSLAQK